MSFHKKKITIGILICLLSMGIYDKSYSLTPSAKKNPSLALSQKITIKAEKKWLLLPVKNGIDRKRLDVFVNGEKKRWIDIELASEDPDWYAYLDISDWKGKTLEIFVEDLPEGAKALSLIKQSNKELDSDKMYHETMRGQIHFSPKHGWNNDPNGLVYYKGEYHLFFQHNPYGVEWGNMHWGHAVSKDLVHWKEIGEALYPDSYGPVYSGSGVVDKNNTSGLGTATDPPMVVTYTSSGKWTQGLAYSTDGRNFSRLDKPVVNEIKEGNRDPKLIWYEPKKKWVMVIWVELKDRQNTIHFLSSKNLKDWEVTSVLKGGIGDDRFLFECPDLYELPVRGKPNEKKWVLNAANGEYAVGAFDGDTFYPEESRLSSLKTENYYAAQTFTNDPKGRKIEIGWFRTKTAKPNNYFNQSMSIPMKLDLLQTPDGIRLSRTPVEEMKKLRGKHYEFKKVALGKKAMDIGTESDKALEINIDLDLNSAESFSLNIRGIDVIYDIKKEELKINGIKAILPVVDAALKMKIFVDRTGLEIFSEDGIFFMPVSVNIPQNERKISISSTGDVTIKELDIYELKSIWK